MKTDDYSLPVADAAHIQKHADQLLREASAYGRFPTPVKDIVSAAKLKLKPMDELPIPDCGDPAAIKRAMSKLQGFLDRRDRTIYVDRSLHTSRRKSLALHEIAHDYLPEQRMTYEILEDSEHELDHETHDLFENAANCFASEVHFQSESFTSDARDLRFGIFEPVKQLTKRYGAGNYSTLRRYTEKCGHTAALLVCDLKKDDRTWLAPRRFIRSSGFKQAVGSIHWPQQFAQDSWFVENRPRNVFSFVDVHHLKTAAGERIPFYVEGFDSTRQVFFLLKPMTLGSAVLSA
jgi:hypothetical protein